MKSTGSGIKGKRFERAVARMIIKAGECIGLKKKDCYRTPMSGGHPIAKSRHPSDLVMSRKLLKVMPASVECKHYRRIDLQWFYTKKGPVFKWIDQAKREAGGRHPIVVFRWNLSKTFCVYPIRCGSCRLSDDGCFSNPGGVTLSFRYRKERYVCVLFSSFLRSVFDEDK